MFATHINIIETDKTTCYEVISDHLPTENDIMTFRLCTHAIRELRLDSEWTEDKKHLIRYYLESRKSTGLIIREVTHYPK